MSPRGRGARSTTPAPSNLRVSHSSAEHQQPAHLSCLTVHSHDRWRESLRALQVPGSLHLHLPADTQAGLRLDGSPSPVVALDLDSTIYPLMDAIARIPGHEGFSMSEVSHWDYLIDRFGGLEKMLVLLDQAMHRDHSLAVAPYAGVPKALKAIVAEHNARVVVMTDRPLSRVEDTISYADHHALPYSAIFCGRMPDKISVCRAIGAEVIADDRPSTMEAAHEEGLHIFSLAHPYNLATIAQLGIAKMDDWEALGAAIGNVLRSTSSSRAEGTIAP